MHSDLEQAEREKVMLDFKNNKITVLVATDIVARGIDIEDIGMVLNFDVPHDPEDYIHRIGRTARANAEGLAVTFVSEKEQGKFYRIEQFLEKKSIRFHYQLLSVKHPHTHLKLLQETDTKVITTGATKETEKKDFLNRNLKVNKSKDRTNTGLLFIPLQIFK